MSAVRGHGESDPMTAAIDPTATREASTSAKLKASGEAITNAARVLIGTTRMVERNEHDRAAYAELSLEVELTGGGNETWRITIERTASSH